MFSNHNANNNSNNNSSNNNYPKWNNQSTGRAQPAYRLGVLQNAATAASESAQYCNMFLQPSMQQEQHNYSRIQNIQRTFFNAEQQRPRQIVAHRNNVPSPNVHYRSANNRIVGKNKNNNNDDYLNHQLRKQVPPLLADQHNFESTDSTNSEFTVNQHYHHYYSYYYNRSPQTTTDTPQIVAQTGRKLPTTTAFMAGTKPKMHSGVAGDATEIVIPLADSYIPGVAHKRLLPMKYTTANVSKTLNDNFYATAGVSAVVQQHVLKEKMPNNNIIPIDNFEGVDWFLHLGEEGKDLDPKTIDFMDVKDVDSYEKLNIIDSKDARLQLMAKAKRKLCTLSDARNGKLKYLFESLEEEDSSNNAKKCDSQIGARLKGGASTKRRSPPVHRVLLYDNQSPRLTRISPSHLSTREKRRGRSKSPTFALKSKNLFSRITENDQNNLEGQVRVIKPHALDGTEKEDVTKLLDPLKPIDHFANNNENDNYSDDDLDDLDNVSNFNDSDRESTSGSEDGYQGFSLKLTQSADGISTNGTFLSSEKSTDSLTNPESLLAPSLFPNVPPYIAFSSNLTKGPPVPAELYRVLKWRVTNVMPKVVRNVLANSGMRLLKKTNDWMGVWGKHMKSPCFKAIRPYQKINHLPGSFKIGRKDSCWKNLQKQINKHGKKDFGFMPKTYIIPNDLNLLRKHWPKYAHRNVKWIIKPPASARGAGIRVVDRWNQIPKRRPLIVQKYIERPLLINGSKFDLRLYVLVTSVHPLRVFMYHNGLARFASVKYSDRSDTLNDRCMHLTNYSINKFSSNYSKNEDVNACHGHKWTLKSLWSYLENRGVRTDCLWEALRNLVLRTILAGENSINNMIRVNMESKYSCFELFGFDVLLDAELIPWLLEVNISPSLHSELPLDAHVKAPLVQSVLNTALFHIPPKLSVEVQKEVAAQLSYPHSSICYDKRIYINYLSRSEKSKHTSFTRKTMEDRDEYINAILDHLTPDDVRCLIVAEDELARCAPLERIFPTNQTYKYLKYTETPRYYNRLLDAWENRYGNHREKGIAVLRRYCDQNYHLEVPPSPAKKDSNVDDGTTKNGVNSEHSSDEIIKKMENSKIVD